MSYQWLILAYLTVLTGAFTVRIPRVNSKFSVSDAFPFINTILFGVAAGVLTAVLDGVHGSVRSRTATRRKQTILFNTAVLGISAYCAGELFFRMLGQSPLSQGPTVGLLQLALPTFLSALVHYLCNSILVADMLSLDGGGNALRLWRQGLATTLPVTLAGVAAGALLAFGARSITSMTLLVVVPILVAIYFVNTIYLQPETDTEATAEGGLQPVALRPAYRRIHYFMVALGLGFVALQMRTKVLPLWRENLMWGLTTSVACALGAVFVSAGMMAITPAIALAVLLILGVIYVSYEAFVEKVPQRERS